MHRKDLVGLVWYSGWLTNDIVRNLGIRLDSKSNNETANFKDHQSLRRLQQKKHSRDSQVRDVVKTVRFCPHFKWTFPVLFFLIDLRLASTFIPLQRVQNAAVRVLFWIRLLDITSLVSRCLSIEILGRSAHVCDTLSSAAGQLSV